MENSIQAEGESSPVAIICKAGISKSKEWIFLTLRANAHSKHGVRPNCCKLRLTMLDLEKTLQVFPALRDNCIFATHTAFFGRWDGDSSLPPIPKSLRFVFPNPSRNVDPLKGLSFLPAELAADSITNSSKACDLLRSHTVVAKQFERSQSSSNWYIPIPDLLGEKDGLPAESEFMENWDSINSTQGSDFPLLEIPRYPWMNRYTAARF